nr:acyl-coenzyme A thioesterase 9, mitochondrial-like [Mirounga angustirostris]
MDWPSVLGGGAGLWGCQEAMEPTPVCFILFCRFCSLNKGLLIPGRGLTQGSQNPEKQRVIHMHEACSPIHVNHVRDKLREIVGASTNWRDHVKAMEERKLLQSFLAESQKGLPPRRMRDSYSEVLLPLGSQPELREKYLTVQNTIRFGRILEDLDSLGVLICYMHTRIHEAKMSPLSIVTALVDKIDMQKMSLSPEQDIKFSGHVSWVGKTSMEVKMQMFQVCIHLKFACLFQYSQLGLVEEQRIYLSINRQVYSSPLLENELKVHFMGHLGGSVVKRLPLAQVVIPGSWDRAPHWAPCSMGSLLLPLPLPLLVFPLSLCLSLSNK